MPVLDQKHKLLQEGPPRRPAPAMPVTLESPIEDHVKYAYKEYYSKPYPARFPKFRSNTSQKNSVISREIHGIQHVTRVAIDIPVFANLFRHYGDPEALALTNEDIKLLQIAALFHDAGRCGEGEDLWDRDSASLLYKYLTNVLHVNSDKAKMIAEATANKDADTSYYKLIVEGANLKWAPSKNTSPKNIYQKLVHDSDCLDIIRARDHFDASYLDFYHQLAKGNPHAFEDMAKLIREKRSLIERQGDSRHRLKFNIKEAYNHADAYSVILKDIHQNEKAFSLYNKLHADNKLLSREELEARLKKEDVEEFKYDPGMPVNAELLTKAMRSGRLFARGIGAPSGTYVDRLKDDEPAALLEARKIKRRPGIKTRTKKDNNTEKNGNPNRSISHIAPSSVYTPAGLLMIDLDLNNVDSINKVDVSTGRGKKNDLLPSGLTCEQKAEALKDLNRTEKMGGSSTGNTKNAACTHNEIIYRITKAEACFFTQDPTLYKGQSSLTGPDPDNRHAHYLQALYVKQAYARETGIDLPIVEYSFYHDYIKDVPNYTDEQIIEMWVEIITQLIEKKIKENEGYFTDSLESLKIEAIDGHTNSVKILVRKQSPVDSLYPPALSSALTTKLKALYNGYVSNQRNEVVDEIKQNKLDIFSDKAFMTLMSMPSDSLPAGLVEKISQGCEKFFSEMGLDEKKASIKDMNCLIYLDYTPQLYFEKQIARVYLYASIYNKELAKKIRDVVKDVIDEELNQIKRSLDRTTRSSDSNLRILQNLVENAFRFDLFARYENQLNKCIQKMLEHYIDSGCYEKFSSVVGFIHKAGILNHHQEQVKLGFEKFKSKKQGEDADALEKKISSPHINPLTEFVKQFKAEVAFEEPSVTMRSSSFSFHQRSRESTGEYHFDHDTPTNRVTGFGLDLNYANTDEEKRLVFSVNSLTTNSSQAQSPVSFFNGKKIFNYIDSPDDKSSNTRSRKSPKIAAMQCPASSPSQSNKQKRKAEIPSANQGSHSHNLFKKPDGSMKKPRLKKKWTRVKKKVKEKVKQVFC